jgi:hypothetical protein
MGGIHLTPPPVSAPGAMLLDVSAAAANAIPHTADLSTIQNIARRPRRDQIILVIGLLNRAGRVLHVQSPEICPFLRISDFRQAASKWWSG